MEKKVTPTKERPKVSQDLITAYIVDGMGEVQSTKINDCKTFNALGDAFVKKVVDKLVHSSEVNMVFDRYDVEDSVKTEERMRRTGNGVVGPGYQIMGTRQIPIWKKFLSLRDM